MKAIEKLKKEQAKTDRLRWQMQLARDLRALKIIGWQEEFKFHPKRKWRFDFAFPGKKLGIEIDGGLWSEKGGHTTGVGYQKDRYKDEAALLMDWRVYRVTPEMVKSGRAVQTIEKLLEKQICLRD